MPINPISPGEYTNQYDLQQMRNNQQNANNLAAFLNQSALSKQGAKQKEQEAEEAFARMQQQQQQNVQTATGLEKQLNSGKGPYGGKVSVALNGQGGIDLLQQQPNVMALMYGMQGKGNKAIADAAKAQGLSAMTERMQTIDNAMKSLSEGTNIGDAAADLLEHVSLAGAGASRALGTILREASLTPDNSQGAISALANKLRGSTDPVLNQKVRDTLMGYLNNQAGTTYGNFESAKQHLTQAIPSIAPFSQNPDAVTGIYTGPGEDAYQQVQKDYQAYKQPKQPSMGMTQLPTSAPTTVGDSVVNSVLHPVNTLENWLKGPQQQPTQQTKPKTVIQNGQTYTLNPQTGQYE